MKDAIALAVFLVVAGLVRWALVPGGQLPGNRVRYAKVRLHLRLHPGRGYATVFELWLRWGRFAAFRKSGRVRQSLNPWQRARHPGEHSVFAGRAHYRHCLRVPLEEHVLVMAPPRTFKTAFLADVILRYPGPVISTTTKADVFQLTSGIRSGRGPVHVFNPQSIGAVPSTFRWSPVEGCQGGAGDGDPPRGRVRPRGEPEGCGGRHVLVGQGQRLPARLLPRRRRPSPGADMRVVTRWGWAAPPPASPRAYWPPPGRTSGR